MTKYKSDHRWKPSPDASPCYKQGVICHHKAETTGMCRFNCPQYIQYENLRKELRTKKNQNKLVNSLYKYESIERTRKLKR